MLAGSDATSGVPMVAKDIVDAYDNGLKLTKSLLFDGLILGDQHQHFHRFAALCFHGLILCAKGGSLN